MNSELQHRVAILTADLDVYRNKATDLEVEILQSNRDRDVLRLQMDELVRCNPGMRMNEINSDRISILDTQLETIKSLKKQLIDR